MLVYPYSRDTINDLSRTFPLRVGGNRGENIETWAKKATDVTSVTLTSYNYFWTAVIFGLENYHLITTLATLLYTISHCTKGWRSQLKYVTFT